MYFLICGQFLRANILTLLVLSKAIWHGGRPFLKFDTSPAASYSVIVTADTTHEEIRLLFPVFELLFSLNLRPVEGDEEAV